jgi:hypothetical protein
MTIGLSGPVDTRVDDSLRALRIIWLAILAGVVVIFVVTRLVEGRAGGGLDVLFWILLALGVGELGASFVLKQKMLRQAVAEQKLELVRSAYILAFALCEAVALSGLIAHLVTGHKNYYFLFALSGFGVVVHKPQRNDLLAAANEAGGVWETKKQG